MRCDRLACPPIRLTRTNKRTGKKGFPPRQKRKKKKSGRLAAAVPHATPRSFPSLSTLTQGCSTRRGKVAAVCLFQHHSSPLPTGKAGWQGELGQAGTVGCAARIGELPICAGPLKSHISKDQCYSNLQHVLHVCARWDGTIPVSLSISQWIRARQPGRTNRDRELKSSTAMAQTTATASRAFCRVYMSLSPEHETMQAFPSWILSAWSQFFVSLFIGFSRFRLCLSLLSLPVCSRRPSMRGPEDTRTA